MMEFAPLNKDFKKIGKLQLLKPGQSASVEVPLPRRKQPVTITVDASGVIAANASRSLFDIKAQKPMEIKSFGGEKVNVSLYVNPGQQVMILGNLATEDEAIPVGLFVHRRKLGRTRAAQTSTG